MHHCSTTYRGMCDTLPDTDRLVFFGIAGIGVASTPRLLHIESARYPFCDCAGDSEADGEGFCFRLAYTAATTIA